MAVRVSVGGVGKAGEVGPFTQRDPVVPAAAVWSMKNSRTRFDPEVTARKAPSHPPIVFRGRVVVRHIRSQNDKVDRADSRGALIPWFPKSSGARRRQDTASRSASVVCESFTSGQRDIVNLVSGRPVEQLQRDRVLPSKRAGCGSQGSEPCAA